MIIYRLALLASICTVLALGGDIALAGLPDTTVSETSSVIDARPPEFNPLTQLPTEAAGLPWSKTGGAGLALAGMSLIYGGLRTRPNKPS